jgi:hypothetical protein
VRSKAAVLVAVAILGGVGLVAAGAVLFLRGGSGETLVADLGGALTADQSAPPVGEISEPDVAQDAPDDQVPGDEPVPVDDSGPVDQIEPSVDPLAGWQTCQNEVYGFRLRYPSDWFTAASTEEQACRFFDPRPFEADADGPTAVTAVNVFVFPNEPFEAFSEDAGDAAVSLERTDLTVGTWRAQLVEATIDSESGRTRAYEYGIDFPGGLLILGALEETAPDYAAAKAVVDSMVGSLETL